MSVSLAIVGAPSKAARSAERTAGTSLPMKERSTKRARQLLPALAGLGAVCAASAVCAACSGDQGKSAGVQGSTLPQGHSESVEHESCDEKSSDNRVDILDANRDGKDDIKRVFNKSS